SAPYEPPENPELVVDTSSQTPEESLAVILGYLESNGYLSV
ncbi:MAG: adenylyl-sulfate kinase, partial [Deltaproteobacteria bacterium]